MEATVAGRPVEIFVLHDAGEDLWRDRKWNAANVLELCLGLHSQLDSLKIPHQYEGRILIKELKSTERRFEIRASAKLSLWKSVKWEREHQNEMDRRTPLSLHLILFLFACFSFVLNHLPTQLNAQHGDSGRRERGLWECWHTSSQTNRRWWWAREKQERIGGSREVTSPQYASMCMHVCRSTSELLLLSMCASMCVSETETKKTEINLLAAGVIFARLVLCHNVWAHFQTTKDSTETRYLARASPWYRMCERGLIFALAWHRVLILDRRQWQGK